MLTAIYVFLILVGLALLFKGASWLLDAASFVAERTGIPKFLIGVTILALGTSIPELIITIFSTLQGRNELVVGNVIGSNISNILLIIGLSAAISPIKVDKTVGQRDIPFSFLGIALFTILAADKFLNNTPVNTLSRGDGLVLLVIFLIFIYYMLFSHQEGHHRLSNEAKNKVSAKIMWGALGLICLIMGGSLVVDNSIQIAQILGISERVIGLTIISIGTSLPELVTMLVSVKKKETELGVGNIIGSNIINLLFILGLSIFFSPIDNIQNIGIDLFVMLLSTILLYASLFLGKRYKVDRNEGFFMVMIYLVYMASLFF